MLVRSAWSNLLFTYWLSNNIPIVENGVLKSPIIVIFMYSSPFSSVFAYIFWCSDVRCIDSYNWYIFWINWPLYHCKMILLFSIFNLFYFVLYNYSYPCFIFDFPGVTVMKNLFTNAVDSTDVGSVSGSGRSPGVANNNPHQYSCLENPMNKEAWWARIHAVTKSQT